MTTEEIAINIYNNEIYDALNNAINRGLPDSVVGDIIRLIGIIANDAPLHIAVRKGRLQVIKEILKVLSPDIKQVDAMQQIVAREYNDDGIVNSTISLLIDISTKESIHRTLEFAAGKKHDCVVIEALLKKLDLDNWYIETLVGTCIFNTCEDMGIISKHCTIPYMNVMLVLLQHLIPNKNILSRILVHATKYRWQKVVEETIRILNTLVVEEGEKTKNIGSKAKKNQKKKGRK